MTARDERQAGAERLAAQIADGTPIDWRTAAHERSEELLDELRIVAAIADLHRAPERTTSAAVPAQWGHFTLLRAIGRGTSGTVFLALDNRLERQVALKLLTPQISQRMAGTPAIEEACLLAKVRHPNVVTVFGAEHIDGRVAIVTEFVEGETLSTRLERQGAFAPTETAAIGVDLCAALAAVHAAGLVHRDVKAHNVMIDQSGRIVLMDLGAGGRADATGHALAGTPLYVAPELLDGAPATPRSDIYSAGVLLFHMLTGKYPVAGDSIAALRDAHRGAPSLPLRQLRPDLPMVLATVIETAIARDPAYRYKDAAEMKAALQAAIAAGAKAAPGRYTRRYVAAAVLVMLLSAAFAWRATSESPAVAFRAREWVLLVPIDNRTGDPALDGVLEHALGHALSTSAHVNLVPDERIEDALRLMTRPSTTRIDERVAREVAIRDGNVRVLLAGSIARVGGTFPITLRVVDPATGETLASRREVPANEAAIPAVIQELSSWVRLSLGESARQVARNNESLQQVTTPSLGALRYFTAGMAAARRNRWNAAEPLFASAVEADPRFASAHIWRAWAFVNLGQRDDALASAQRALDLATNTTDRERHFLRGSAHLIAGEVPRAAAEFETLLSLYPDDYWGQKKLFNTYVRTRARSDVRRLALSSADARPHDPTSRLRAADEVLRADGLAAARPHFARARSLVDAAGPNDLTPQYAIFLRMFQVHDLWAQRRIADAAETAAVLERDPITASGGDWALNPSLTFHLSLGQPRAAERLAARLEGSGSRALAGGWIALARSEEQAIPGLLQTYTLADLSGPSLLLRAGQPDAAERLLRSISTSGTRDAAWSAAEIEAARGTLGATAELLEEGIRVMRFGGARSFLYAETLATARAKAGDVTGAIALLEEQTAGGDRALSPVAHLGFLWMRSAKQLADLYRTVGRLDDARRIEGDLMAALSHAEPDFPLLVELRRREGR